MDRDHRHLHADLPATPEDLQHRSLVLRAVGGAQHPDLVPVATGRDGAVLSQGRGARLGQHQRHLPRRAALYVDCDHIDDHALHLPADRPVVAEPALPLERSTMGLLVSGVVAFVLSAIAFWYCLPRDGKLQRLVDTEWEPYVGVAFCAAVALGLTMMLSGTLNHLGTQ